MREYLVGKLVHTVIVLVCVLTLVFVVLHLTGDPVMMMLPSNASQDEIRALTAALGLDQPLAVGLAALGQSAPIFWTGLMLMLVFAVTLKVLPTTGYGTWRQLVMPALTLAAYPTAAIARLVRAGMLEVLDADYVRTARAKGL